MAQVTITINLREYAIACENGQELQIMKLGRMLDEKAKALTSALGQINENQLLAMVGLLVADELSELKKAQSLSAATEVSPAQDLSALDTELAESIDSLNEAIKSVASKIKSV